MLNKDNNLKKYVCVNPFRYMDIQDLDRIHMCCPSWLPTDISEGGKYSVTDAWRSETAEKIRSSVLDGSYKYCNHKVCPSLNALANGVILDNSPLVPRDEFVVPENPMPEEILYGQDRSCNLKCPSCRKNIIPNDPKDSVKHLQKQKMQDEIETSFGSNIKKVMLTGSGDPIYSKLYREFLQNFKRENYPSLETIHLITNGVLLDEKMWNSFKCKEFIHVIDISYDAGTQHTYEKVSRLGGDWNKLVNNTKFLTTIDDDVERAIIISFVVTQYNYQEMFTLYELINNISLASTWKGRIFINFRQIVYWQTGAYTIDQIKDISVFDPGHPEFDKFLDELKKINQLPGPEDIRGPRDVGVTHNFHHLLETHK